MYEEIVLTLVAKSIIKSTLSRFIWLNKKKVIINKGKKVDIKYPHSIYLIKYNDKNKANINIMENKYEK